MAAYSDNTGNVEEYIPFDSHKRAKKDTFNIRVDTATNTRCPNGTAVTYNHKQMAEVLIAERPERFEHFFKMYLEAYTGAFAGWDTSDDDNEIRHWESYGADSESYGRDRNDTRMVRMANSAAILAVRQYERNILSQNYLEW